MIAKAVKGKGFRGALEYDLTKEGGQVLDTNMAGENPRELAAEFGEIRKLRPNLGKAVLHVSLSASLGESLTDTQWREIGKRYIDGMGLENNQYIITRHTDTEHEHIHLLANRIRFDGGVTSDSLDYARQEALMRGIERDYGLVRVAPSIEAERRAPTKGEIEVGVRTGRSSARQQLQLLADGAAQDCGSFSEYEARLASVGVELMPVVQMAGAKLSGLMYRLDGVLMKGSDLGKAYSPAGLAKRGITYEQDRDGEAIRRCGDRAAARAVGEPGGDIAGNPASERGGAGRVDRAVGAVDGGVGGRDAADAGGSEPVSRGAGEAGQQSSQPGTGRGEDDAPAPRHVDGRGADGGAAVESRRESVDVAALRAGGPDGGDFSGSRERIVALAGATEHQELSGPAASGRVPEARRDRSLEALQRQVAALGVDRFEVGLRDSRTGQMVERAWSRAELERSCAWLKRMNARGSDVLIRPAVDHGLVLLVDLKREALDCMVRDGFAPAVVLETRRENFQVWVKLSENPVPSEVRQEVARELATKYGADVGGAAPRPPNARGGQVKTTPHPPPRPRRPPEM